MGRRQKTPGPGAYDVPKHLVIGSPDPRLSSNFASKVPRTLHHTDHFGDPGQYDLQKAAPSLGQAAHRSRAPGHNCPRSCST